MLPATIESRELHGLKFTGPVFKLHQVPRDAGVVLVLQVGGHGRWTIIDTLYMPDMRLSLEGHGRTRYWRERTQGVPGFAYSRIPFPCPEIMANLAAIAAEQPTSTWEYDPCEDYCHDDIGCEIPF